ncbi:hypothetical protein LOAG_00573 [Loa loa]|uniref:Uncharacterized protein n=1 Tax=Loa loa TaxID=7209 RepID=A0A1S0UB68_LOALO|nr:hypothetical protein LOAG_00573 [Loa loa]EFO27912.1 hypothetical protein LOAG_00573 [Loa loa]
MKLLRERLGALNVMLWKSAKDAHCFFAAACVYSSHTYEFVHLDALREIQCYRVRDNINRLKMDLVDKTMSNRA